MPVQVPTIGKLGGCPGRKQKGWQWRNKVSRDWGGGHLGGHAIFWEGTGSSLLCVFSIPKFPYGGAPEPYGGGAPEPYGGGT